MTEKIREKKPKEKNSHGCILWFITKLNEAYVHRNLWSSVKRIIKGYEAETTCYMLDKNTVVTDSDMKNTGQKLEQKKNLKTKQKTPQN